jgi:predicted Fe-Mo cluster-binding NifX family protein
MEVILMKVAVAIEKNGRVSRHLGTCRGFLIYQESRGNPVMEVVRLNPLGGLVFGPSTSEFPRLNKGVKQFMSGSLAFSISRALGDCDALLCRGGGPLISRHLKEKGLQVITTQISDPQKALGVYWNQIKRRAA